MKLIEFTNIEGRVTHVNPDQVVAVREWQIKGEPYEKPTGETKADGTPDTVTTVDFQTVTAIETNGSVRILVDQPLADVVKLLNK